MKLTALLLLIACLQVSARVDAQITLSETGAPLKKIMGEIEKQSGYLFWYNNSVLEHSKPVTIHVSKASLEQVLLLCFSDQALTYSIVEKVIVLKEKDKVIPEQVAPPVGIDIQGIVTDDAGKPLEGASVEIKGAKRGTHTDAAGKFELKDVDPNGTLVIQFTGYQSQEIRLTGQTYVISKLPIAVKALADVDVQVSTGYQTIPKERATGSFVHINNEIFNRRVSSDVLSRLEGITSGLLVNANIISSSKESPISIRGRSTILGNTSPLIVVDNFPYEGDINNINPNDVESITVLKDAAAASIWGVLSGNGVIVITTKKGRFKQPLKVSANVNFTSGQEPDLFYNQNFLPASEFIDIEQFLFSKGFYDADINNTTTRPVLSPVVEILARKRSGVISASQAEQQISNLRSFDIRNDISKYLYRESFNQQYSISLTGGEQRLAYQFSVGYDDNVSNLESNLSRRFTISNSLNFLPVKNLEISTGINYVRINTRGNNTGVLLPNSNKIIYYPYARLADDDGNYAALPKDYRFGYVDTAGGSKLLSWRYRPLEDLALSNHSLTTDYLRFTSSIKYSFSSWISAEIRYQHERSLSVTENLQAQQSYFSRNLINLYSQVSGNNLFRPIPVGDILDLTNNRMQGQILRGQLNVNRTIGDRHNLVAIAGMELRELLGVNSKNRLYGYDKNVSTNKTVNYDSSFRKYGNLATAGKIPYPDGISNTTDEFSSVFSNLTYTYNSRYLFSASGRVDKSNLFGVNANQKAIPLWSAGMGWNINKEDFYKFRLIPVLNMRVTYGYNGNIDKTISALTTATYATGSLTGAQIAVIQNPPYPDLRWEQVSMLNVSVGFESINRIITGNIDFFWKKGSDLLGMATADPTSGVTSYKGNVANMSGQGFDLMLTSRNSSRNFKWNTMLLISHATDKVTDYKVAVGASGYLQNGDGSFSSVISPVVGKPVYSIASYKWAGLDPTTGDPQGYVNGQVSKDYVTLTAASVKVEDLVYHGSARPTFFGSLRNDFSYRQFSLSVNLTYKLNYYFRRQSIQYSSLFNSWLGHVDYLERWQKPGDEKLTNVPSLVYPSVTARNNFYQYSEALVEKGDHVRLQDIQLRYTLDKKRLGKLPFDQIDLYVYVNNLGIIWKATKHDLDPDFLGQSGHTVYPNPRTISFGLRTRL